MQPLSAKATAPRTATAAVATPDFRLHRPCSYTKFYGWRSQSSYPKLPSISPRNLRRNNFPTALQIPHATKDEDAIADAQLASAAEAFMPEEWPDFSKKKANSDVVLKFFNRKKGYDMIMNHLKRQPTLSLLLLGPKNSGKSELIKVLKEQEGSRMLHMDLGMHDTSSPALMAQQLHKQARKLPEVVSIKLLMALATQLGPVSNLYKLFYPDSANTTVVNAATPTEKIVNAFMADVFPPYTATNLTALIDAYNMILDNLQPAQTKPVIVVGVAKILASPQKAVTKALEFPELIRPPVGSDGPRIWEAKHYKAVLRLITTNPYHAVCRKEVHAALDKVGIPENVTAARVLESMVEFNVVSLRLYSDMAQDVPREAFFKKNGSKEKEDSVVIMPSPAHLAAVLELDVELEV